MADLDITVEGQRDAFSEAFQLSLSEWIEAPQPNLSIFSHTLDRVVFVAYFLGAVVPLVALGVVIDRHQLTELADPVSAIGLLGLVGSICLLSLSSFFMLRRMTSDP